jgi:hypothetical protein
VELAFAACDAVYTIGGAGPIHAVSARRANDCKGIKKPMTCDNTTEEFPAAAAKHHKKSVEPANGWA